jgi:hypothetical protein
MENIKVIDKKKIGTAAVLLVKENDTYVVVDNHNAYYPYQKLETAKLSFAARCSYLEKKEIEK